MQLNQKSRKNINFFYIVHYVAVFVLCYFFLYVARDFWIAKPSEKKKEKNNKYKRIVIGQSKSKTGLTWTKEVNEWVSIGKKKPCTHKLVT